MKIYLQDCGVYGMIVVTALNKEDAIKKISGYENYKKDLEVKEFELEGFEYCNLGDM